MRTTEVELNTGLKIGEQTYKKVQMREATAGDLIEATEEAEKLVRTEEGYELVSSPSLVSHHVLRRQIVSIGDHPGPLTLSMLKTLSGVDLSLLHEASESLSRMTVLTAAKEVATRGRSDQSGGTGN